MKQNLKHTKVFVIVSIVLSMFSFFTTQKGWSEIYPFYFWKLYSQPAGWSKHYTSYRVYAKKSQQQHWTRLENRDRASFNRDETLYLLNHITARLLDDQSKTDSVNDQRKLKKFCEYIAPEYDQYKVVAEDFNPLDLIENEKNYDTTTVITVP